MNKERSEFIYELVGIVKEKRLKTKQGREWLKLTINLTNYPDISFIQVFKDKLANKSIWEQILSNNFIDKRYLFYCHNYFGKYHLINWRELAN